MLVSPSHWAIPKRITIKGDGSKILNLRLSFGKLANSPNAPGKKSTKVFLWPGVFCICKVMVNGSAVFDTDGLENFTRNQFKP